MSIATYASALPDTPGLTQLAQIIQLAVAPVFLLAGLGAFLNVCAGRLARIVDRTRNLEPRILKSRGEEHERLLGEVRLLDRRTRVVTSAIFTAVLGALFICAVVILMVVAFLTGWKLGVAVAWLFIIAMTATGASFAIFLHETRLGTKAVRVRNAILDHQEDAAGD
jgi:MFS family permease